MGILCYLFSRDLSPSVSVEVDECRLLPPRTIDIGFLARNRIKITKNDYLFVIIGISRVAVSRLLLRLLFNK